MLNIEMTPFVGCGKIRFGMTRNEVEQLLGVGQYNMCSHIYPAPRNPKEIFPSLEGFYFQSSNTLNITYRIRFTEDRVSEISIFSPEESLYHDAVNVLLYGIDVFKNTAEYVVTHLEQEVACTWDCPDKDLSYFYTFHKIGFELWRDGAFHPKLYNDSEYMKIFNSMPAENQEYELRFLHFQVATLRTKELQENLFNK